jgi:hypothetical protein
VTCFEGSHLVTFGVCSDSDSDGDNNDYCDGDGGGKGVSIGGDGGGRSHTPTHTQTHTHTYTHTHTHTHAQVAVTLLVVYSLGYPLVTLAMLCRANHARKLAQDKEGVKMLHTSSGDPVIATL